MLLEIEDEISRRFIPFAGRKIDERTVDITGTQNAYDADQRGGSCIQFRESDLYRIRLDGEIAYDRDGLSEEIARLVSGLCYFVSVKDETVEKSDAALYEGDASLKGEFVRGVLASEVWDAERKSRVIALGLKALTGQEVDG